MIKPLLITTALVLVMLIAFPFVVGSQERTNITVLPQSITAGTTPKVGGEVDFFDPKLTTANTNVSADKDPNEGLAVKERGVHIRQPESPYSREEVRMKILETFPNAPIMVRVAACESGLNPLADREGLNVDVGLFQINQVHLDRLNELGLDRRDIDDNLKYARILYDESGLDPWYMSEHCWG